MQQLYLPIISMVEIYCRLIQDMVGIASIYWLMILNLLTSIVKKLERYLNHDRNSMYLLPRLKNIYFNQRLNHRSSS